MRYKVDAMRLNASTHIQELELRLNSMSSTGWKLHSIEAPVRTVDPGGLLTVDRVVIFEREEEMD